MLNSKDYVASLSTSRDMYGVPLIARALHCYSSQAIMFLSNAQAHWQEWSAAESPPVQRFVIRLL
jgi:hypothetical protein